MRTRHSIGTGLLLASIMIGSAPTLLHAAPMPCCAASMPSCAASMPSCAELGQDALAAESVAATAPISEVTLYQGRAMIARTATSPAREGLFELRFENLPGALDPATLQATVSSARGGAKLLDVRYEEKVTQSDTSNNPDLRDAITALEAAKRVAEMHTMQMAAINDRYTLLAAIRTKTATESAKDFGSKSLDPDALGKQIAFLDATQAQLIADRAKLDAEIRKTTDEVNALQAKVNALGGQTKVERTAVVSVGQSMAASADVTLRYLVGNAGWAPRYAVRADVESGALTIEYDAEIRQATGESWNDVKLTLSTAQPTRRAAPGDVPPVYVDVVVPMPVVASMAMDAPAMMPGAPAPARRELRKAGRPSGPGGTGGFEGGEPMTGSPDAVVENKAMAEAFADASAVQTGTVVSFPLARAVTIPSDAQRSRKQRIATVDAKPSFVHVARPLVESAVYLKAVAANASQYQFLAGPATVFLGGDSVGSTTLPDLAPGAEMTFWLGTDRRIEAKRVIVKKDTSEKGVFDKADVTKWEYRVDLTSTDAKPVTIELVDRMPVSRNEQIKVELKDVSQPVVTDAKYVADEKPQGILKWLVQLPARAEAGKPATKSVSWTVLVSKPKDVNMTGLPE